MKKLKAVSLLKNNLIYYAIALTIVLLMITNMLYVVLLFPYVYFLKINKSKHLKYIGIMILLFLVSYIVNFSNGLDEKNFYKVVVISDIEIGDYTSFTGKIGSKKVIVYLKDSVNLRPGDVLEITGELNVPDKATTPYGFDYQNYLKSMRIYQSIFTESYEVIDHNWVVGSIPYNIEKYIDHNIFYSKEYVKTFVLADKQDFDQDTINEINNLGISHLFAVSGMHIGLIVIALKKILESIKVSNKKSDVLISLFLLFYIVITSFAPSVIRASLMFIFLVLNKQYKLELKTLDILSIIFILLLIINPFYIYSLGFILSFFVTFTIILSKNIVKNKSGNIQILLISTIAFFFTLPIVMNVNHEINLLSIVYNLGFIYFVTFILLPFSYLIFVFPIFDKLFVVVINIFESSLSLLYKINFLKFSLSFHNVFIIILYYIFLTAILINIENKKKFNKQIFWLFFVIFFASNIAKFNFVTSVNFIDVYGDSTLMIDQFDNCNILIDTGEVDDYNTVINYMKNKGIKRLDYLIITHMHSDHYGEADDIIKEFKVKNLVTNNDNSNYLDKTLSCGNFNFYVYSIDERSQNENNNSLIVSLNIEGENYLFTGDIEKEAELNFVEDYEFNIDILKVAHHGSNTSSTDEFISTFLPKEAVIIAHRYNKFNHPNIETIETLEKYGALIHQTKLSGTIEFKYFLGNRYIFTHPPR